MYAKIFSQIFDSTLAEDYMTRHVFMDLLVLADENGHVDMTLSAISRRLNMPVGIVKEAMDKLAAPDVHSRSAENEGRRIILLDEHRNWGWRIPNYPKYRLIRTKADRTDYWKEYKRKVRAKPECPQLSTLSTVGTPCPPSAYASASASSSPSVVSSEEDESTREETIELEWTPPVIQTVAPPLPTPTPPEIFEAWFAEWSAVKGTAHKTNAVRAWLSVVTPENTPAVFCCTRGYLASIEPGKGFNPDNFLFAMAKDNFTGTFIPRSAVRKKTRMEIAGEDFDVWMNGLAVANG